ncbi:MAG: bifunctional diguanylate cyclase/phosphodiesterase [Clostridiales bacterium]|nr:bifunctional diguanylate cyclase/phosphodiesterase [Clostridiales bacterium]
MGSLKKLNEFAIDHMMNPVLVFDHMEILQVCNMAASELLTVHKGMRLYDFIQGSDLRYILTPERRKQGKTREFTLTIAIGKKEYLIHGQELRDEKSKYLGLLLIYNDISGHERLKDEATYHATRDPLTGFWNREFFSEMAERTLADNPDTEFLMIVTDINHFKMFNDILGKKAGDEVLLSIAGMIKEKSRSLWVTSRIGGDSFAVLIPKSDYEEKHLLNYINTSLNQQNYALKLHIYVGVYEIKDRSVGVESMYDRAFMAIESIKGDMQQQVAYYDESMRSVRLREAYTVDDLEGALQKKEVVIFFQPVVEIRNERLLGFEALVRWRHPTRGLLAPNEFIPLFEKNGMIARLDYYVWDLACKKLSEWKDTELGQLSLSVNISAKDFFLSDLYANIVGLVDHYKIGTDHLKLEITESALALDIEKQLEIVNRLQEHGFIVEMDDFGSGYSSLNSLKDIMADVMKIDMKFFEEARDPKRARLIIESVIELAGKLHMPIIAEGVETGEQLKMLKDMGCQMVQGYYYAKPMPEDELIEFIGKHEIGDMREVMG